MILSEDHEIEKACPFCGSHNLSVYGFAIGYDDDWENRTDGQHVGCDNCNARLFKYDPLARGDYRQKHHPTMKPLAVMNWCIGLAGDVETILDPFAGSGTTGRAAKDLGKRAVLIEREEQYCEIAANRMAQEVLPISC